MALENVPNLELIDVLSRLRSAKDSMLRSFKSVSPDKVFAPRALIGLLFLALTSHSLKMDFNALLTLGGVSLRGEVKTVREDGRVKQVRLLDPDRRKRKALRRFINELVDRKLVEEQEIAGSSSVAKPALERTPPEGIICYVGYVQASKLTPGTKPSVYKLKLPEIRARDHEFLQEQLLGISKPLDESITEIITREVELVYERLLDLIRKNKIDAERTAELRTEMLRPHISESASARAAYVFACFNDSRQRIERVHAALYLFAGKASGEPQAPTS